MTHPLFRAKLEAIGFGVFIPVFFVTSGVRYDLDALLNSGAALTAVPVFLLALLVIRGLPALLYKPLIGGDHVLPAALLQATSLPFIVAATAIGLELGVVDAAGAAALIAAGLLSVVAFPGTRGRPPALRAATASADGASRSRTGDLLLAKRVTRPRKSSNAGASHDGRLADPEYRWCCT